VFGIDNITDERYLRAPASEANDPAELGRNYKVTVSYQF
jgi:outer membrane receptor protein involved in Fe transport